MFRDSVRVERAHAVREVVAFDVEGGVRERARRLAGAIVGRETVGRLVGALDAVVRRRERDVEAAVVLRSRVDVARDELKPELVGRAPAELRVQRRVVGAVVVVQHRVCRLRVEPVGREARAREYVVERVGVAREHPVELAARVRAGLDPDAPAEAAAPGARDHVHDAAGVRAIDEALRAAQDLDALEVGRRDQAVEIRRGLGAARVERFYSVDDQQRAVAVLAADPKRRVLARAARVRDADARLRAQRVGERLVTAQLDRGAVDHRHGRAELAARRRDEARGPRAARPGLGLARSATTPPRAARRARSARASATRRRQERGRAARPRRASIRGS